MNRIARRVSGGSSWPDWSWSFRRWPRFSQSACCSGTLTACWGRGSVASWDTTSRGSGSSRPCCSCCWPGSSHTNLVGRKFLRIAERVFTEVPLIRRVYGASKEIVSSATLSQSRVFKDVVMVEYPRKGTLHLRLRDELHEHRQRRCAGPLGQRVSAWSTAADDGGPGSCPGRGRRLSRHAGGGWSQVDPLCGDHCTRSAGEAPALTEGTCVRGIGVN